MHRASLYRLVPAFLLLAAAGCNNDGTTPNGGSCEADLAAGALVITEIMADPKGSDDSSFEWFEIHNPGATEVVLTGVGLEYSKIDDSSAKGHQIKDALTIPAGGYVTVGKATAETLPDYLDYGYGADLGSMGNTNGKLKLVCGEVTIDEVLYQDLSDGHSRSLGRSPPDAAGNDDLAAWCDGADLYNGSEYGTPGAANPECPLPVPACGMCYENGQLRASRPPAVGQLVISEIMPNAALTDMSYGEWFELSVVDGEFDLNCLQYGGNTTKFLADPSKPDMTIEAPECIGVRAGDIKLFAEQETAAGVNFPVDFALVDSPSDSNPSPGIYVAMGGQILDEAHYAKTTDGAAWSLDPDMLDAIANDDPVNWCLASTPFAEGDLGTPGAVNPQCPEPPPPAGTCMDGDTARPIVYANPGDLMVTEVFTDPMVSDSSLGEWIELFAVNPIDLNGLTFGKTLDTPYATVSDGGCLPIAAGSLILIAKTDDAALNGGLPTPDWIGPKIALTNDASTLVVGVDNQQTMARTALDTITWGSTADGKAQQFPIDLIPAVGPIDETINDDPALWCAAAQTFGAGDFGTPKADNLGCGGGPVGAKCTDPDTMMPRDIKNPVVGDLIITELLPDPDALIKSGGAGEPTGEWFEVFAAADFDLNGLDLGNTFPTKKHTVASAMCLPVTAGSHVLFAGAGKPTNPPNPMDLAGNGGLPTPNYEYTTLSLSNSGASLYVGIGDLLLDTITFPKPAVGKATQLSTAAACTGPAPLDPACNDDLVANWCAASTPYGLGDLGTPQAANLDCGGGNMDAMCFDAGMNAMRPIVAPKPGDLVINEYMADPNAVTDANGEWFEIAALAPVDLNDLKILNKPNPDMATVSALKPALVSNDCLRADAGSFVLFAHQSDPLINGGLPAVDHVVSTSLTNTNGGLSIAIGDTLLHTVAWVLTQKAGKSTLLDPDGMLDPMNTLADGPPWCYAADGGTPKAANPQCP
jgi:hypothetical protein